MENRMYQHFSSGGHLSKKCYNNVSKIEYLEFDNPVDMDICEIYYINKYIPIYNTAKKYNSNGNIQLPESKWEEYIKDEYKRKQSMISLESLRKKQANICCDLNDREWTFIKIMWLSKFNEVEKFDIKHKDTINGILWRYYFKEPWVNIPDRYGKYTHIKLKYSIWNSLGIINEIFTRIVPQEKELPEKELREEMKLYFLDILSENKNPALSIKETCEKYNIDYFEKVAESALSNIKSDKYIFPKYIRVLNLGQYKKAI